MAAFVLIELWGNLNPIRTRLGLPELSSAALYRQPSRGTEGQQAANDQSNAEIRLPSAAANPSAEVAGRHSDDGKGLDWPAWIQALSAVATGIATVVLVSITSRQAGFAEKQVEISRLQTIIYERQAGLMTSQNDLSFATQRAWVRADVKIAGPVQVDQGGVTLSFELDLVNTGALPAYTTRPDINVYPWGATTAVNDVHITYRWARFKPDRVIRQAVIFPRQNVVFPYQGHIRVSDIEQASNTRGKGRDGFVIAIRGIIWYDYPGSSQVHSTTFHAHIVRRGECETPASWGNLPTEDGALIPASDLAVTLQIGETDAT